MSRPTWLQATLLSVCGSMVAHAQGVVPSPPWGASSNSSDGGTFVLDGTVARADRPLFVNGLVVGATSADGGVSSYAVKSVQDAPWQLGPGTQMRLVPSGNDLTVDVGAAHLPTTFITQPACNSGQTCRWFADNGSWFGVFPSSDVSGCAAGTEGGIKANSGTHRATYCDGTTPQKLGYREVWSGAVDFAAFGGTGCQDLTFTATGAVAGEPIASGGCGSIYAADADLQCGMAISATDTATVRVCCSDVVSGCGNPPSITFTAAALR